MPRLDAALDAARRPGGVFKAEYRVLARDGNTQPGDVRWVTATGRFSSTGQLLLGVLRDITERKREQLARAEGESRLRSILEAANVIAWETDLDTGRVYAVGPAARLFDKPDGFRMENRAAFLSAISAEDREPVLAAFEAAAKVAGRPFSSEFRVPLSDGSLRWIGSEGAAEQNNEGQLTRMRGISFDITRRKAAELALAESLRITAVACEAGRMGTWHLNCLSKRLDYSDETLVLLGITRDQWGCTLEALEAFVLPDDIERRRQNLASSLATGHVIDIDFRIRRPDGEMHWLQSRGRIVRDARGTATEGFGVLVDITERKRAEESQRLLTAELDHRVKNVLAKVVAVLERTREGSNSLDDFVKAVHGRINAMAHTHSLLSSSRWMGASLAAIVREELMAYTAPANTMIAGPDILLNVDAAQALSTVIHELATNAAKYGALSTSNGVVSVRWEKLPQRDSAPVLVMDWVESDGPQVSAPARLGYGTSVIRNQIPFEFSGKVDLTFAAGGVRCRIEVPLARMTE